MALLLIIGLFSLWIYSSRNTLGGFLNWVTGKSDTTNISLVAVTTPTLENKGFTFVVTPESHQVIGDIITSTPLPTYTPYPTSTPYPTQTPPNNQNPYRSGVPVYQTPMVDIDYDLENELFLRSEVIRWEVQEKSYRVLKSKYSYYWPPFGGINCDYDCNYMASGQNPKDFIGIGWACDASIPFWTQIYIVELDIYGRCMDRGGAIVQDTDGLYWFDQLIKFPMLPFGSSMTVHVYE